MQPEETARFTLGELVEASGVNERTIRYYIAEGLAPPALGRGRASYYTPAHLQRIELIARLRDERLSIDEIRERLSAVDAPAKTPGDVWERHELRPGLELHVRTDVPPSVNALAREIVSLAGEWFGPDEPGT